MHKSHAAYKKRLKVNHSDHLICTFAETLSSWKVIYQQKNKVAAYFRNVG